MPTPPIDLEVKEKGRILLLPPYNYSIRRVADELGVGISTVQKWRQQLKEADLLQAEKEERNDSFTAEQIFSFVIESATMSEHELSGYCREKGLYIEQIKAWKAASIQAHQPQKQSKHKQDMQYRVDRKKIKELEKELARKDKALAETAALLVLREKFNALWEHSEDD